MDVAVDAGQVAGVADERVAVQQHDRYAGEEPTVELGLEQRRIGAKQRLVGIAETGVDLQWHVPAASIASATKNETSAASVRRLDPERRQAS